MTLTDYLSEIKDRLAKRTPGRWSTLGSENDIPMVYDASNDALISKTHATLKPYFEPEDAIFIAAAPTDLETLIQIVERMEKGLNQAGALVAMNCQCTPDFICGGHGEFEGALADVEALVNGNGGG